MRAATTTHDIDIIGVRLHKYSWRREADVHRDIAAPDVA